MSTAEELRAQISAAQLLYREKVEQTEQLDNEIFAAKERQRLRRELERIQSDIADRTDLNSFKHMRRMWIDNDLDGDNLPEDEDLPRRPAASDASSRIVNVANCSEVVVQGQYVWNIKGLSWLVNTLKQTDENYVESEMFSVGGECFCLAYNPMGNHIGVSNQMCHQQGSLVIIHHGEHGITFRYKIYVKRAGGDFLQWGKTGDECHPTAPCGKAYGPDVQMIAHNGHTQLQPVGVFGLKHEELLESEWVEGDALTVKVEVEVRPPCDVNSFEILQKPNPEVPPATLGSNLLALLENGKCSDVTFIIEGERIKAHSQVLCARSEVFDRQLLGGMSEASTKEIVVEDCDVATFKALLQFLYTDDFACLEALVKSARAEGATVCASSGRRRSSTSSSSSSSCSGNGAANESRPSSMKNRLGPLQGILAVSHKYQVSRLGAWCEQQLCEYITVDEVCSVLVQAHLYEAKWLEDVCLTFIKNNLEAVVVTPSFGALGQKWAEVMLKINIFIAGVSETSAAAAIATQRQVRHQSHEFESEDTLKEEEEKLSPGTGCKRKRSE